MTLEADDMALQSGDADVPRDIFLERRAYLLLSRVNLSLRSLRRSILSLPSSNSHGRVVLGILSVMQYCVEFVTSRE